jgi:membrane protein
MSADQTSTTQPDAAAVAEVKAGAAPGDTPATTPAEVGPAARQGVLAHARGFFGLLWATIFKFFSDNCSTMAASLSFYTFFSLPALLTLLLTLVGRVMDPTQVQEAIIAQVGGVIGAAGSEQVRAIISHAKRGDGPASVATLLSVLALAFGATTTFAQLQDALNRIWSVKPDPRRNQLRVFLVKRIFSFGIVVTVSFLLLVSLVLSTAFAAATHRMTTLLGAPPIVLEVATSTIGFVLITMLFAVMYRYLPDARIAWRDVGPGAIGTALLFVLGKTLLSTYLGGTDPGSAYGAAGSLAVVLIWVYYTSMILLFGAEFTELWAERYGRGVVPQRGAIAYEESERRVSKG